MDQRWPARAVLALTVLLVTGPRPTRATPPAPIAWQEPAPLARLFLQLPFDPPEPLAPGHLGLDVTLRYTNTILLGESPSLSLEIDLETAAPSLLLRVGLAPGLEAQLQLAGVIDYGGFLDRPIEVVEGLFNQASPQRFGRPRDISTWRLRRPDGRGLDLRGGDGALADPWVGLTQRISEGSGFWPALSARAALALPISRPPGGAGQFIPAAGLLAGWTADHVAVRLALDLAVPTARLAPFDIATQPYWTAQLGFTWELARWFALQIQGAGHGSPLTATGFAPLDAPTYYVMLGGTARLGSALDVDLAVIENVFSPFRGADISFVLAFRFGR